MHLRWFEFRTALALCVAAAMPALTPVAAAHADANDDQFVAALDAQGMPGDRGTEISIAHRWCDSQNLSRFSLGMVSPWQVAMQTVSADASAQGITPGPQETGFWTAARDAYCPGN